MAFAPTVTARNTQADALLARLNKVTTTAGAIVFHTSGHAVVATCVFADTAFHAAVNGVAASYAIGNGTTTAGTIAHAHLVTEGGTDLGQLSVTTYGGGGDIEVQSAGSTLAFGTGETISVSSGSFTQPA